MPGPWPNRTMSNASVFRSAPTMRGLIGLFGLMLLLANFALGADDELLKEFKRYFRKYKESAERIEAVLSLDELDVGGVVDLLVPILKDKDPDVVSASVRVSG